MARQDRHTIVQAWIAYAQEQLHLDEWKITIAKDAADVEAWADIDTGSGQNYEAELRLSHDFFRQTAERQRLVLTHELLHLASARYARVVENLEDALGKVAWAVLAPQIDDGEERMVEFFANLLAPGLDLPNFPKA